MSTSSEKRRIEPHTFDSDVPPLNTRWPANGASNRTHSVATTQTSFSRRCAFWLLLLSATSKASRLSVAERSWYRASAMREVRAHRFRHPDGHEGPCGAKLLPILVGERRQNRFEAFLHLFGTEPCQGADDVPRLAMWGCQLPPRSVAKRDGERAEVQSPVWAGGQIDRANRICVVRPRQLAAAPPHGTIVSPHNVDSVARALPTRGARNPKRVSIGRM